MSNWRDQILRVFTPNVARLTLVADPDGLLLEEGVLAGIRERGFELIPFEDHIAFRYAYESKFRSRWDQGELTDLVVVLRSATSDLSCLPYDLLQAGRRLSFNLGKIFPNLSYPIVAALSRGDVDKIMHGMELGAAGMHNQVRQWAGQPFMANLIDLLLKNGYRVHLTSDHGNIEATGCGRPAEGAVADLRGERSRIYSDSLLRSQVKKKFTNALEWPPVGLPENYLPLLAPKRSAFVRETEHLVGHGGASLEELVVPLVQIERRDT